MLEAKVDGGHGGVDVKGKPIRGDTMKRCMFDGEIYVWIKQTSFQIIK